MKNPAALLCLILAAGAGFALGWYPDKYPSGKNELLKTRTRFRSPASLPTELASAIKPAVGVPVLPSLTSVDSCRQFLKEIDKHYTSHHPLLRDTARDFALRRWLELDAESALTEAESVSGPKGIGNDLFRVWLDLNPQSALAAWNQTSPALAKSTRDSFLSTLAETDVAGAFALLKSPRGKSPQMRFDPLANRLLRHWAQTDPLAALAATKTGEGEGDAAGKNRTVYSKESVWEGWATSDPAGLLAYAKSNADRECNLKNLAGWLVPTLLKSDPKAAAEVLEVSRDSTYSLVSNWCENDPEAALAWARTQPADSKQALEMKVRAAGKLATANPLRAIALLEEYRVAGSMEVGYWMSEGYRQAFVALSAGDPDKAMEMILSRPEIASQGAMSGYMNHAFAKNPEAALAQAKEWLKIPALAPSVGPAISKAFSVGSGAPPQDFSPVLAALPELAPMVSSDTMKGWALAAPESAAEFLASRERGGKPMEGSKNAGVLTSIASARPEWTSQWLESLPEGQLRQDTAEILTANWSNYNPEATKAWIDTLPPGPSRDSAVSAWAKRLEVPDNPFMTDD